MFALTPKSYTDDPYEPRSWVSWHEIWRCVDRDKFSLREASWVVYWGWEKEERMTQVIRAEWDQAHRLESSPSTAGHPHWHVDTEIVLPSLDRLTAPPPGEILERGRAALPEQLSIQRMHLAMGGWRNRDAASVPDCWQYDFPGSIDELAAWGERTLRYLQSQSSLIVQH